MNDNAKPNDKFLMQEISRIIDFYSNLALAECDEIMKTAISTRQQILLGRYEALFTHITPVKKCANYEMMPQKD